MWALRRQIKSLITTCQGCDVPNIEIVVQWKTPTNMSSWIQRLGRAARGLGRKGLAVMLVERTAFEANATGKDETESAATPLPTGGRGAARGSRGASRGRGGRGRGRGGRGRGKDYGILHHQGNPLQIFCDIFTQNVAKYLEFLE